MFRPVNWGYSRKGLLLIVRQFHNPLMPCRDTRHWIGDEGKAVGFIVADGFAV
jgi:hypothetical protein